MSSVVFVRRFLGDYSRNPVNLMVLVLVPAVFVVVAAGSMADAARALGGANAVAVQTATAGWAAGFLAGIAMYFQTSAAHAADRRLVLAGLPPARLVTARLVTGLVLAVLVSATALIALALRTGIHAPVRVIVGTLMFAVIYLAIGALVGALVPDPVNGTVVILFVWILDVFFGPAVGSADPTLTRFLPTHFVTMWMVDLPGRHGGWLGDLGWAVIWTVGAAAIAWTVLTLTTRTARTHRPSGQLVTGLRMGLIRYRRNPVLWVLLFVVPAVFVLLAKATTPNRSTTMLLSQNGTATAFTFWLPDVHAGTMAPIAIGSLAALAGLFITLDAGGADRRLSLAGFGTGALLGARLGVIGVVALVITAATLGITATVFHAHQWWLYMTASVIVAATYALIGMIIGPLFGRVAGVFVAFLVPFLDLGMTQSPMLRPQPAGWAHALPGYGANQVLLDAGLTDHFDQAGPLGLALAWLAFLGAAATILLLKATRMPRARQIPSPQLVR